MTSSRWQHNSTMALYVSVGRTQCLVRRNLSQYKQLERKARWADSEAISLALDNGRRGEGTWSNSDTGIRGHTSIASNFASRG